MSEEASPILDVDLGANGARRVYRTVEELEEWSKSENAFWDWLRQTNWDATRNRRMQGLLRQSGLTPECLAKRGSSMQLATLTKIDQAIQSLRKNPKGVDAETAIKVVILAAYAPPNGGNPTAIHSGSPAAEAVDLLRKQDLTLGANALAGFLKVPAEIVSTDEAEAICRVVLHNQGIKDTAAAERAAMECLLSEFSAELAEAKKAFSTTQASLLQHQTVEDGKASQRQKGFDGFMEEAKAAQAKALASSQQELASIEKTYNEKLALQASVSYWTKKASKHTLLAWGFAALSAIVFGLGGWAIYKSMGLLIGAAKINEVEVWKLGVVVILATVAVWAIRVAVRLLMSNIHLHDDAEERTTMLLTYLAMLREGKLPEGDVRQLILQALFRPAATGIVKDDATPPFMAQWLKATTGVDQ